MLYRSILFCLVLVLMAFPVAPGHASPEQDQALIKAAGEDNLDQVKELIAQGANANAKNNNNFTALMYAAAGGRTAIVETLLAKGADVNAKDQYGSTALMIKATSKNSGLDFLRHRRIFFQIDQVMSLIEQSGIDRGTPGKDKQFGCGL
jgi:ankyrin repeat protein